MQILHINNEILALKGGHLDFSHLTELKYIYITEIHMKKHTNHEYLRIIELQKKKNFYGIPLKGYEAS